MPFATVPARFVSAVPLAVTASIAVPAVPAVAASGPLVATAASFVMVVASRFRCQPGGDQRTSNAADQFEAIAGLRSGPGVGHCGDLQAVETADSLRLQHRADCRRVRHKIGAHFAFGTARPGGSPGPGAIISLAGQFDLESSGHGPQSYTPQQLQRPVKRPSGWAALHEDFAWRRARPGARAARERSEQEREALPERPVSAANKSGNTRLCRRKYTLCKVKLVSNRVEENGPRHGRRRMPATPRALSTQSVGHRSGAVEPPCRRSFDGRADEPAGRGDRLVQTGAERQVG